jgi:hypothetical protein
MQRLLENLAATSELMGQPISPLALEYMAKDLKQFPVDTVIEALNKLRRESKGRLTLAAIVEKIEELNPDGRPKADEAWAMIPQDEQASAVITQEMAEAMGIAQPLLDEGDKIGARMAFRDAYNRIVDENKRNGVPVSWFPCLGWEKSGRIPVLAEAVRLGRLTQYHALTLIAPEESETLFQLAGVKNLSLENKSAENIQKVQTLFSQSRLSSMVTEK